MHLGTEDENRGPDEDGKHQVDGRAGQRNANLALRIQAALRLLVEQRNSGDRQQHHAAHANPIARRHHDVTKLMRQHRKHHHAASA